jgi:hypothetical protein
MIEGEGIIDADGSLTGRVRSNEVLTVFAVATYPARECSMSDDAPDSDDSYDGETMLQPSPNLEIYLSKAVEPQKAFVLNISTNNTRIG